MTLKTDNIQLGTNSVTPTKNIVITNDTSTGDLVFNKGNHDGVLTEINRILNDGSVGNLAASSGASLVGYMPAGVGAVATDVQAKLRDSVSVLEFIPSLLHESIKDGSNTTPLQTYIQSALDSTTVADSPGFATTIYFPSGYYRITATVNIPALCEFYGDGQLTIIQPVGCTALNFLASNVVGTRRIAGFWIYGSGNTDQTAIICDLDSGAGGRVTGLLLENVYISFYGIGIYARGLWNATFRKVVILNTWKPVQLVGRSVKTLITDCNFSLGYGTGTGNSTGVLVDALSSVRPEDTWIVNSIIYGFDNAVNWASGLNGGITGCDLDVCTKEAIIGTITDGGFVVTDNWIAVSNAAYAVYGIKLSAVGSLQTPGVRKISGNNISSYTAAPTNSVGVFAGTNTNNVNIKGNVITGFETGIHISVSYGFIVKDNTTTGTTSRGLYLETAQVGTVADNTFDAPIVANASNTGITFGKNSGASSTYILGSLTIPPGATTVTATLTSLGIPNIPANVAPYTKFMYYGGLNRGAIWGNCFSNTLTLNLTTAAGGADAIQYEVTCGI